MEYRLPRINQVQVNERKQVTFANTLRSFLRQDPDIILIGEMRDLETIEAALTIAETGHLTFATLHTNSAAQTINRIVDSFPGDQQDQIRVQLASSLIGIFSQRLIPHIAGGLGAGRIRNINTVLGKIQNASAG